jgi:hypothetical protein
MALRTCPAAFTNAVTVPRVVALVVLLAMVVCSCAATPRPLRFVRPAATYGIACNSQ